MKKDQIKERLAETGLHLASSIRIYDFSLVRVKFKT